MGNIEGEIPAITDGLANNKTYVEPKLIPRLIHRVNSDNKRIITENTIAHLFFIVN